VSRSRSALAWGLGVAFSYVALAALSGHLSPLARRPLLDGFTSPPPYRWVSPPPSLASGNKRPSTGSFTIDLSAQGSQAGVFSTNDLQASIVFADGAFPAAPGQSSIHLMITPQAPSAAGPPPAGMVIAGNVYRFQATLQPGGQEETTISSSSQFVLSYPSIPNPATSRHTLLFSSDGMTWQPVSGTIDSIAQQQVLADVRMLGFFAVGATPGTGASGAPKGSIGNLIPTILVGGLVAVIAIFIIRFELRHRRRLESHQRPGRRPPPRPRRDADDW
jgi:hypothetical protein